MGVEVGGEEVRHPLLRALIAIGAVLIALGVVAVVFLVVLPSVFVIVVVVLVVVAVVLPVAILVGALRRPAVVGSGVERTEARDVEAFHEVRTAGAFTVNVTCGEGEAVTVAGDDNLLEHVAVEVQDGVLRIATARRLAPKAGLTVEVSARSLDAFAAAGACKATIAGLDCERFTVKSAGSGSIQLAGRCREADVRLAGAATLDARELICEGVDVQVSGSGRATVHASARLSAKVAGAGSVECAGSPADVTQQVAGAAKVEVR